MALINDCYVGLFWTVACVFSVPSVALFARCKMRSYKGTKKKISSNAFLTGRQIVIQLK